MNSKYEFLAEAISQQFLKLWAITTQDVESDYEDDLFMFCQFDNI